MHKPGRAVVSPKKSVDLDHVAHDRDDRRCGGCTARRGGGTWRKASGLSERALRYALTEGKMPHPESRERLLRLKRELG
jgi:hypothetical protein